MLEVLEAIRSTDRVILRFEPEHGQFCWRAYLSGVCIAHADDSSVRQLQELALRFNRGDHTSVVRA